MRRTLIPIAAALLIVPVMVYQAQTVEPVLCEAPVVSLGEIDGFSSEVFGPSEAELNMLPCDTQIERRRYADGRGAWFDVSLIVGGSSKGSIHRSEGCLAAQGYLLSDPQVRRVAGVSWQFLSLSSRDAGDQLFAYTFFNQDGFRTSSHVRRIFRDVWDRSVLGRIDRWVMVTVHSSVRDDRRFAAFLSELKGRVVQ